MRLGGTRQIAQAFGDLYCGPSTADRRRAASTRRSTFVISVIHRRAEQLGVRNSEERWWRPTWPTYDVFTTWPLPTKLRHALSTCSLVRTGHACPSARLQFPLPTRDASSAMCIAQQVAPLADADEVASCVALSLPLPPCQLEASYLARAARGLLRFHWRRAIAGTYGTKNLHSNEGLKVDASVRQNRTSDCTSVVGNHVVAPAGQVPR